MYHLAIYFSFLCLVGVYAVGSLGLDVFSRHGKISIEATSPLYPAEMQALHDLYIATNGPAWHYRTVTTFSQKWNFTSMSNNPCTQHWQGLQCTLIAPYYHIHTINMLFFALHGQLPSSISALSKLSVLSLGFNKLSGTLPSSLGLLSSLQYFDVSTNNLEGSIPSSLGNLVGLQSLDVSINKLEGKIPTSFVNLTNLQAIDLGVNKISGTIPCFLEQLTSIEVFHLYNNSFTGTIPDCVCHFAQMEIMDLSVNRLTGTIPAAIAQMLLINSLYLYDNLLTGSIPQAIGALTQITNLEVYNNSLSGELPESIGNLRKMSIFALHDNKFHGTLPAGFCNMNLLQYVYINSNHFSGALPDCLWNLPLALFIDASNNIFSSSIPHLLGNLSHLQYLILHNNALTGSLPLGLVNVTNLVQFQVQYNAFSGPLNGLFGTQHHQTLTTIQLNNNQITGTLPPEIFLLPKLYCFVAAANCFHGSLPDTLCSAVNLNNLVLDGLSSAASCRELLLPGQSGAYTTQRAVHGTLPVCLLEVHSLTTLHLSGNGLTGTLPARAIISNALLDLTLSHNQLSGEIPNNFQTRQWFNLDLSYNRIAGTLHTNFASDPANHTELYYFEQRFGNIFNFSQYHFQPTLLIANNRLSGMIPSVLRDRVNISMLGTNVFSCKLDRTDLPKKDSGKENYQCGSDSFDTPYYLWISLLGVAACGACVVFLSRRKLLSEKMTKSIQDMVEKVNKWCAAPSSNDFCGHPIHAIQSVFLILQGLQSVALWCAIYAVLVLLPLYCILSHYYGTLTHQYAWIASAAYLSGPAPTAWLMTSWLLLVILVLVLFVRTFPVQSVSVVNATNSIGEDRTDKGRYIAVVGLFTLANLVVVVGVNSVFVYIAIYRSATLLLVAQILISLFKIVWNNVCSALILRQLVEYLMRPNNDEQKSHQFVSLQVFVALLNNIVIPCLVVAVISPDCFYTVFDAAPAVESQFTYPSCVLDDNFDCYTFRDVVATTSFNPPFRYNYQCSSSLITYYSPAFVILCLVQTFFNPVILGILLSLHTRVTAESFWHRAITSALPLILLPLSSAQENDDARAYFDGNRVLIIVLTLLGLLLTFGAVFPPLAVSLLGTILATVILTKVKVGRFLCTARELNLSQYVSIIEKECQGVGSVAVLHNSLWMLITISCLFYTLFLFDTLGDAVGFKDSLWVLVVIPSVPIVMYLVYKLYLKYYCRGDVTDATGQDCMENTDEVEMKEVKREDGPEISTFNVLLDPQL